MKKLMNFYACLFLSLVLLYILPGCEKDPVPTPVPVPTIELRTSNGLVPYMGSTTIYYHVLNGDVITLNGEPVFSDTDSLKLVNMTKEVTITVFAKNSSGENSKSITIFVKDRIIYLPTILVITEPPILPIGGGEVTFTLHNTYTDSVYCDFDNKWYAPNSIIHFFVEQDTTRINFRAVNADGIKNANAMVLVEQPPLPLTIAQLICLAPWQMIKLEFKFPDGDWFEGNVGCQIDDILTFYLEPQTVVYDFGEIKCGDQPNSASGPWTLNGNLFDDGDLGGVIREIIYISADTLVWVYCFEISGSCTRETFVHPPQE